MTVYVALIRGINVGGRNAVPMADLRAALAAAGMPAVRTYIQSGNIVVDSTDSADQVATTIAAVIEQAHGLTVPVIVVSADVLARIVAGNPFPAESDHRRLHAIIMPTEPDEAGAAALAERVATAEAKSGADSRDALVLAGRVVYLHTPDGFGTSELAKAVGTGARNPAARGTARNWATITTLLAMATGG